MMSGGSQVLLISLFLNIKNAERIPVMLGERNTVKEIRFIKREPAMIEGVQTVHAILISTQIRG